MKSLIAAALAITCLSAQANISSCQNATERRLVPVYKCVNQKNGLEGCISRLSSVSDRRFDVNGQSPRFIFDIPQTETSGNTWIIVPRYVSISDTEGKLSFVENGLESFTLNKDTGKGKHNSRFFGTTNYECLPADLAL